MAVKRGMITLRQDGWKKVIDGVTTPMEVMNVTSKEELLMEDVNSKAPKANPMPPRASISPITQQFRTISREILSAKNEFDSRAYQRVSAKVKVRYKIFHSEASDPHSLTVREDEYEHSTLTKDLSAGGLLFVAGHALIVGTILDLKIQLEEKGPSIDCLAKVSRVEEDEINTMFRIAVYYLDIASADRVKINEFVKNKMSERESLK